MASDSQKVAIVRGHDQPRLMGVAITIDPLQVVYIVDVWLTDSYRRYEKGTFLPRALDSSVMPWRIWAMMNRQRREKTSTKGVMVEEGGTKRRWKILGRLDTVIILFCFEKVKNLGWNVMEICETCSSALTSRDSGKEWMWPNGGLWDLKKRMGWHPVWADFCCERKGVNIYTEMYGFFG